MNEWGRFTVRGGAKVEERIGELVSKVSDSARAVLSPSTFHAIVLIGGYGRGEGGVEIIDGVQHPHNNLDFLVVTKKLSPKEQSELKQKLDDSLSPISREYGVGLDVSAISASKLKHSPCLVMWYDMRFGHKTILGDRNFIPFLKQFSVERIAPWDVRNLLVNRGTLLVINEMLLERGDLNPAERKTFVKHVMKCIIGYGDALLFFHGDYHWSYAEKQRRMKQRVDIDPTFQALYDDAMEFRFQPNYEAFIHKDFTEWTEELRDRLAPVHLFCESHRLSIPSLTWDSYASAAFANAMREDLFSLRGLAKKAVNTLRSRSYPASGSFSAKMGYRCSGRRGRLPIFFPLIAYHLPQETFREIGRASLRAASNSISDLRTAYLREWSRYGDENFPAVLKKLNLSLVSEDA